MAQGSDKQFQVLAVGRSGVGKSTLGNVFLTGKTKGPFKTSNKPHSCTQGNATQDLQDGSGSFTDVPGIPDTDPHKTVEFYDKVITAAKQPLNAILFVFKKERVDTHALKQAALLFRELGKAKALKILVVTDHANHEDDDSDEDQEARKKDIQDALVEMAEEISRATSLQFDAQVLISDKKEMPSKIAELKQRLSRSPKPEKSEHLKTFEELRADVATLTSSHEILQRVREELEEQIAFCKSNMLVHPGRSIAFRVALAITTAVGPTGMMEAAHDKYWENKLNVATAKLANQKALEQSSLELEEAVKKFEELNNALRCGTEDLPGPARNWEGADKFYGACQF